MGIRLTDRRVSVTVEIDGEPLQLTCRVVGELTASEYMDALEQVRADDSGVGAVRLTAEALAEYVEGWDADEPYPDDERDRERVWRTLFRPIELFSVWAAVQTGGALGNG